MSEKLEVDNENLDKSFTFCTTMIVINLSMVICAAMVFVAVKVKTFRRGFIFYSSNHFYLLLCKLLLIIY